VFGNFSVRLAANKSEIKAAQRLRYDVFYSEMGASPSYHNRLLKRDMDKYDRHCDHLILMHNKEIIGTYRLLRHRNFYSEQFFDLKPLLAQPLTFLELGRSCIAREFRNKNTLDMLFSGIWDYINTHNIDVMFGCASFPTTKIEQIAPQLSYLQQHRAQNEWLVKAKNHHPLSGAPSAHNLPPLIKTYLRMGATFGEGYAIDHQFGTTDVFVIMPIKDIKSRYIKRFS
jgi:L-ornithine Nalpha-acyltransferase